MTIKVEREALLRVISKPSSAAWPLYGSSSFNPSIRNEEEFVIVDSVPTKLKPLSGSVFSYRASTLEDDDQASLCTFSTSSVSSWDSSTIDRKVSFASQLVTDVWTRERTPPEDVPHLFYTSQQTQTFRQEYRLEKKVIDDLSINPATAPVAKTEFSNNVTATTTTTTCTSPVSHNRHRISHVVVLHNDKLETFFDPFDHVQLQMRTSCSFQVSSNSCINGDVSSSDFFDNDSFWSGSLTWY